MFPAPTSMLPARIVLRSVKVVVKPPSLWKLMAPATKGGMVALFAVLSDTVVLARVKLGPLRALIAPPRSAAWLLLSVELEIVTTEPFPPALIAPPRPASLPLTVLAAIVVWP